MEPWKGCYQGPPLPVLQCRELYYCVKDSMERAAARQQSIKPGEEQTPQSILPLTTGTRLERGYGTFPPPVS